VVKPMITPSLRTYVERLAKYLPIQVTAAYTLLDGYVRQWAEKKITIFGLMPTTVEWSMLFILTAISLLYLHKQYTEARQHNELASASTECVHMIGRILVFVFWTYLIDSMI
jgi:uncharacterized membrane protein